MLLTLDSRLQTPDFFIQLSVAPEADRMQVEIFAGRLAQAAARTFRLCDQIQEACRSLRILFGSEILDQRPGSFARDESIRIAYARVENDGQAAGQIFCDFDGRGRQFREAGSVESYARIARGKIRGHVRRLSSLDSVPLIVNPALSHRALDQLGRAARQPEKVSFR